MARNPHLSQPAERVKRCLGEDARPDSEKNYGAAMRRSKELMLLLALLLSAMAFVLWYVIDRRAKIYAHPPAAQQPIESEPSK